MQENVTFGNGRGERLAGVLHLPRETVNGFGVILCHGMESSKESLKLIHLGDSLSRAGFTVLRFDFTGAGESSGEFECITCTRHVEDLEAAHGLLKERGLAQAGVIGSSMGGTTALMHADATVPVAQGRALHAALPGEKELCILPGADHRFTREEDREAALGRAEDWVFRHLRRPAA